MYCVYTKHRRNIFSTGNLRVVRTPAVIESINHFHTISTISDESFTFKILCIFRRHSEVIFQPNRHHHQGTTRGRNERKPTTTNNKQQQQTEANQHRGYHKPDCVCFVLSSVDPEYIVASERYCRLSYCTRINSLVDSEPRQNNPTLILFHLLY